MDKATAFEIENITNASIVITSKGERITIDPWFSDGIYMGTWHNFPRVSETYLKNRLENVDVCLFTHLHKDHFDINTIKLYFKPHVKFIFPKIFGWQVMEKTLNRFGYKNTTVLECVTDTFESKDFLIKAVPPLNVSGLESRTQNSLSIDGGFVVTHKKTKSKCIFLADDNLYAKDRVTENMALLKEPDLICFAYSGFASDYPFNYNFTLEEKVEICNFQEEKRFRIQIENLKAIKPKCIMPYSSEFVAVGNHAKSWQKVFPLIWTSNKRTVASRYSKSLGVKSLALYPEDKIKFTTSGNLVEHFKNYDSNIKSLLKYAESIKSDEYKSKYKSDSTNINHLRDLINKASVNYRSSLIKFNLKPTQNIYIYTEENFIAIICIEGKVYFDQKIFDDQTPKLELHCPNYLLKRLLNFEEHFDDACLSMRIQWKRIPNYFCSDTFNALNYLKV